MKLTTKVRKIHREMTTQRERLSERKQLPRRDVQFWYRCTNKIVARLRVKSVELSQLRDRRNEIHGSAEIASGMMNSAKERKEKPKEARIRQERQ